MAALPERLLITYRFEILFNFIDECLSNVTHYAVTFCDISDGHLRVSVISVLLERYSYVVAAVKFFADDARTKCVAVKTYHEVEHSRSVGGFDGPRIFCFSKYLFCKIEGTLISLLERKARVILEQIQDDGCLAGK